eukprot:CAMPEP_0185834316 /NCGR_PEP_ID=MMETSP1353-20130828/5015_1 /TAXON_ID=1077150 /ORGANISM="Erythrolobus australicus, Strain CCMP3124" /LENGTH=317 /DNA_ID=CAMNT_0028532725 /DNA_START=75 /DNA_END=1028 /DNA_ORIENTATION=-
MAAAFVGAGVGVGGVAARSRASEFVCARSLRNVDEGAAVMVTAAATARRGARSTVQMNLFERFSRVVRSTANNALKKVEDPEKILQQSMIDMQGDLTKVRQAYAEVAATKKRLERQRDAAQKQADEWTRRAQLALRSGDEELAREALVRKTAQDEQLSQLNSQIATLDTNTKKMADSVSEIEARMSEAKAMKEELVARARTAQTTYKVNDMLNSVGSSSGLAAFESMREKVEQLEAQTEVTLQLSPGKSPDLESKFRALESGSSVDAQLAAMKQQMQQLPPSSSTPPSTKPLSASSGSPFNPVVDAEIERMKRDLKS